MKKKAVAAWKIALREESPQSWKTPGAADGGGWGGKDCCTTIR
jgi:hypothetical protein